MLAQVIVVDEADDDLSLDPTNKKINTVDNTIDTNRKVGRRMTTSNEESATPMLESFGRLRFLRCMHNVAG